MTEPKVYRVTIYSGPHYTDPVAHTYRCVGSVDQIREGARVKCQQIPATRDKRVWVDLFDEKSGSGLECAATHWIFDEGTQ